MGLDEPDLLPVGQPVRTSRTASASERCHEVGAGAANETAALVTYAEEICRIGCRAAERVFCRHAHALDHEAHR